MSNKMTLLRGDQGATDLALIQQYSEQVIRLAGAQRMMKLVHADRVKVWEGLAGMLCNLQGLSSPEVKDAAAAFANTPGEGMSDAYRRLAQAAIDYRPEAENAGEGELLSKFERILLRLVEHHGDLLKKERALQEEAMQHQAEAMRIREIQTKGQGGVH